MPDVKLPLGGRITDTAVINACSAAGIKLAATEKTRLSNLKMALEQTLRDTDQAKTSIERASKLLFGANLIKATCDAFLDMAGAMGDAAGIKGADSVAKSYSAVSKSAEAMSKQLAGQKADWVATGTAIATKMIPGKVASDKEALKDLAELHLIKVEIINSAMKNEKAKTLHGVFLGYLPKIAAMSLHYLEKKTAAKYTQLAASVAKAGAAFSEDLEGAFDQRLSDQEEALDWQQRRQRMILQIKQVAMAIADIDKLLADCKAEIKQKSLSGDFGKAMIHKRP